MAQDKKETLKRLLKKLHEGAKPGEIKVEFKKTLGEVTPVEIARVKRSVKDVESKS